MENFKENNDLPKHQHLYVCMQFTRGFNSCFEISCLAEFEINFSMQCLFTSRKEAI